MATDKELPGLVYKCNWLDNVNAFDNKLLLVGHLIRYYRDQLKDTNACCKVLNLRYWRLDLSWIVCYGNLPMGFNGKRLNLGGLAHAQALSRRVMNRVCSCLYINDSCDWYRVGNVTICCYRTESEMVTEFQYC